MLRQIEGGVAVAVEAKQTSEHGASGMWSGWQTTGKLSMASDGRLGCECVNSR